jgi:hypothetical protein
MHLSVLPTAPFPHPSVIHRLPPPQLAHLSVLPTACLSHPFLMQAFLHREPAFTCLIFFDENLISLGIFD